MSKVQKSNNLYKTPFSKAYWKDAMAEMKDTRMLVFAALMIALRVALKLVYIPLAPNLKINTAFIANAMGAMVFGPVMAFFAAIVSDFLGVMLSGEAYFPPFVLTEIAGSMIFALMLYRAKLTLARVAISRFLICLLVNILLQTPLMMLYYQIVMGGKTYILALPHIFKNLFMFPVEAVVLTLFLAFIEPITYRMKLTYNPVPSLRFEKKQLVALGLLFVIGCVCVAGYLGYYYENNSLTLGYSASERVEKNQLMDQIIEEKESIQDENTVSIIGSAYKKFLGKEITYNVAYYAVAEDADKDMDTLWGLKKTPASQEPCLSLQGNATIVINDKTGEVLSYSYTPVNE